MKKNKIDTLILGCTHYPLLKGVLHNVMGPKVQLVDSAQEVALQVKELLTQGGCCVRAWGLASIYLLSVMNQNNSSAWPCGF